ncbi:hypothetical protein [Streptomyces sp. NPDC005438]
MREGIHIPATVVRLMVGAVAVTAVALSVANAPDVRRYLRIRAM